MTPEQDRLVTDHLNLVGYLLATMPGLRLYRDPDGLRGAGNLGLVQAAAGYQPHTGVPFRYYALTRIRGAILDEMRTARAGSRAVYRQAGAVRDAEDALRAELSRHPSTTEVADQLGWTIRQVEQARQQPVTVQPVTLEHLMAIGREPAASDDPAGPYAEDETRRILQHGIARLKPRLQLVVRGIYFDGQRQREIAVTLGVTEARVSQLLAEAVRYLRLTVLPQLAQAA